MATEVEILKSQLANAKRAKLIAQARFYDMWFKGENAPTDVELKAKITYLEDEIKKIIHQREELKHELEEVKKCLK